MNPTRYRHAYLHSTEAGEKEHVVAAALELRKHKTKPGVQAGHLFVDSHAAFQATQQILTAEMQNIPRDQYKRFNSTADLQKYTNLKHALNNMVNLADANSVATLTSAKDKLYVKGHGSPTNDKGISTVVRKTLALENDTFLKGSISVRHQIRDVATGVMNVGEKLGQEHLDVRMTSCGSGGGYDFDSTRNTFKEIGGHGVAGSLKHELLHRDANRTYTVHGYRGSTNSTNPTKVDDAFTHFKTSAKFPQFNPSTSEHFDALANSFPHMTDIHAVKDKVTIERTQTALSEFPALQNRANPVNQLLGQHSINQASLKLYKEEEKGVQIDMRRSHARVRV